MAPGAIVATMSENTQNPSEQPYDPATDPDSDPEQLVPNAGPMPSQAEGEDDDSASSLETPPEED